MNEKSFSDFPKEFVEPFLEFCDAPAPEPAFISHLEQRLLNRQTALLNSTESVFVSSRVLWARFFSVFVQRKRRYSLVLLLVVLTLVLLAIGPQHVLAQVQRWLGYVPGIGFVNLAETRVLVSPVEATRDGVHLRVEQVISGPERTKVVISSPGLLERNLPWPNETLNQPDFIAFLVLPDGTQLETTGWQLNIGAGKLEFPALPAGVEHVTLLVPRLPLVPAKSLPEDWEIPLNLRLVRGELNEELFPKPYSPLNANAIQHGITLRVLNVAQTASETAVQYQVEWSDPDWEFRYGLHTARMPELRDDVGHIYFESPQSHSSAAVMLIPAPETTQVAPTSALSNYTGTLVFPSLSLSASQAKLWVDSLEFWIPAEQSFRLDLGAEPKVGDSWPLDIQLEIAGFPMHLTEARLREEVVDVGDGRTEAQIVLEFSLDPLEEQGGFRLASFDLSNPELGIYGSGGLSYSNGREIYKGRIDFTSGKVPTGIVELQVTGAALRVNGPWEAIWAIPGKDSAHAAHPVRFSPETTVQPDGEMRPIIEEVFLSDRLTAVKFGAVGLPPNASFIQALTYNPTRRTNLFLEDNWDRRYEWGQNLAIIRPGNGIAEYDPHWQFFAPLQPLAQRLSLHIPAFEVLVPAKASFEVEVPQDLQFKQEEYQVTTIGGGGPARQETQTHWVSDPWQVDINLEIAGYELQFTEARVEHAANSDTPYLLFLKGKPITGNKPNLRLNELKFSKIERPDGKIMQIDNSGLISYPYGGVGPVGPFSSQLQAMIVLDVTNARQDGVLSGRYRIEIDGVTEWISGPWEIQFSLSGN